MYKVEPSNFIGPNYGAMDLSWRMMMKQFSGTFRYSLAADEGPGISVETDRLNTIISVI